MKYLELRQTLKKCSASPVRLELQPPSSRPDEARPPFFPPWKAHERTTNGTAGKHGLSDPEERASWHPQVLRCW